MVGAQGSKKSSVVTAEVRIIARFQLKDKRQVFYVTSRSHPGMYRRVLVLRARLSCGCEASIYTGTCAHRRLVHDFLAAEIAERDQAHVAAWAPAREPPPADARETALLRRSNRPFSVLK